MPFRRSRRFSRRPRRRTRWFSIIPNAFTHSTNNQFTAQGLSLQIAGPVTVPWAQVAGHTVLRTILDLDFNWDIVYASNAVTNVGDMLTHLGIFMSADDTIGTATWDPNVPSGDFMHRDHVSLWWRRESNTDLGGITKLGSPGEGRHLHIDTNIRRRVRENDQMWLAARSFKNATNVVNGFTVGYTGRVLLALP